VARDECRAPPGCRGPHGPARSRSDRTIETRGNTERSRGDENKSAAELAAERVAASAEHSTDMVGVTDADGLVVYMNGPAQQRLGRQRRESELLTVVDLFAPRWFDVYYREVRPRLLAGEEWCGEIQMLDADREAIDVDASVTGGVGPGGEIEYLVMSCREVVASNVPEVDLTRRASHDLLTGLPNRVHLMEHLDLVLMRAARSGGSVGVVFVDLDDFKGVNSHFSHSGGDIVLRDAARRIAAAVRPSDMVARLAGDEFVVACETTSLAELRAIGKRVLDNVARSPFEVGAASATLTASVGVAVAGPSSDAETLVREADAAMYSAKRNGRARVEVFDDAFRGKVRGRDELAHELALAVGAGKLDVLYQPVIDLQTGTPAAIEAMVAWNHPVRGHIEAAELRYLAEDSGVSAVMGMQLIRRAGRTARVWERTLGRRLPRLQVEVAPELIADERFAEMVAELLADAGMDPRGLSLEVSEAAFASRAGDVLRAISELRVIGVAVTIDDFGSGGSSLDMLRQAEIDGLKIASPFIDGLRTSRGDRAVVTAAVGVARALDAWSVASGVQTVQQLTALRELECDAGQGVYFAAPASADRGTDLLTRRYSS
jgi:diguanylate cyclase (GGDEF)-like protein